MKILEIAFTCYPVTDVTRARDFYERILGLKSASTWGDNTKGWFEYEIGPHTLAITNFSDDWKPSSQGATLAFEVENLDAAVAELKGHQITFAMELTTSPVCRFAIIQDPDGNKLFMHSRAHVALPNIPATAETSAKPAKAKVAKAKAKPAKSKTKVVAAKARKVAPKKGSKAKAKVLKKKAKAKSR